MCGTLDQELSSLSGYIAKSDLLQELIRDGGPGFDSEGHASAGRPAGAHKRVKSEDWTP